MAIAFASGAMDAVHRQRRPSLHGPNANTNAHAPLDGGGGGALSIGVFSVDELLWTCRPTDPTTLQHQKGCRLFERQERMFFARPGREIIRAGYRPEDAVELQKRQEQQQQQQQHQGPPPLPHHAMALAMSMSHSQEAHLQAAAQAQSQQLQPLPPLPLPPQTQQQAQAQAQAQIQMQMQMPAPPAGPLTTHHFVLEHERERSRPSSRRGAGRRGGGSGAATPRRRRRTGEGARGAQTEFEPYGGTGLDDESDALGMIVDGHGIGGGADPRHRDRDREEAIQMALAGEHTPRTRQPARSRGNSSAQGGPMSPTERGLRADAGVPMFGEPSPFVASGR